MHQNIVLDFIESDIARFFGDNMDILNVDVNNINLYESETIIDARIMAWRNGFKELSKKLLLAAWHRKRWWDWPVPKDEKKETEPFFADRK